MRNKNLLCHQLPPIMSSYEFRKRLKAFYRKKHENQLGEKGPRACHICKSEEKLQYVHPLRMWLCKEHFYELFLSPEEILEKENPLHHQLIKLNLDPELIYEVLRRSRALQLFFLPNSSP